MRKVLITVLMMMALITVSAAGEEQATLGEDTLVIKGYKIRKVGEGVSLTITNAVTEMLGESGEHEAGTAADLETDCRPAGDFICTAGD